MKKYKLTLLFTLTSFSAIGQLNNLGTWNILNIRYKLSSKWSLFTEGQVRSLRFYDNFHYHEWIGGVVFRPNPQITITLAGGDYSTYREGGNFVTPINSRDIRLWPQVTFTQELGRFRLEHRYRSEQRFTLQGFRLRFRSRIGVLVPLNTKTLQNGSVFLSASNELFFTTRAPYFERNRFLIALGKRFSTYCTAHLGFVRQFDYRINDETGRNFMQVSLQLEVPRK